jgi:hypothetical protein
MKQIRANQGQTTFSFILPKREKTCSVPYFVPVLQDCEGGQRRHNPRDVACLDFSRTQTLIALLADIADEFISWSPAIVTYTQPLTDVFQYLSGIAVVLEGKIENLANEYLCLFFTEIIKD